MEYVILSTNFLLSKMKNEEIRRKDYYIFLASLQGVDLTKTLNKRRTAKKVTYSSNAEFEFQFLRAGLKIEER